MLFGPGDYAPSSRAIAVASPALVVAPAYRLAPEHPFPAAHDDVLAAWRWVREHAEELGGDAGAMAIGGESVGGAMAVATCLQLLSAGEPLPLAQVCAYPLVTARPFGESSRDSADARPI